MNINPQQYNAVVEGLRTQLELQRAMTKEKIEIINRLVTELKAASDGGKATFDMLTKLSAERSGLCTFIDSAVRLARGESVPLDQIECPAQASLVNAIIDLRFNLDDARLEITKLNARKRKRASK